MAEIGFESSRDFKCLITEDQIKVRVASLGSEIAQKYKSKSLTLVGVLKGAFLFMADLIREIPLNVTVDFMEISTYGNKTESSGLIKINKDLKHSIAGEHVLVVEDIIDTGLTMRYLIEHLQIRHPLSVGICALLRKRKPDAMSLRVDYVGFDIDDEFVVGYGLDCAGKFRNLRDLRILPKEAFPS